MTCAIWRLMIMNCAFVRNHVRFIPSNELKNLSSSSHFRPYALLFASIFALRKIAYPTVCLAQHAYREIHYPAIIWICVLSLETSPIRKYLWIYRHTCWFNILKFHVQLHTRESYTSGLEKNQEDIYFCNCQDYFSFCGFFF